VAPRMALGDTEGTIDIHVAGKLPQQFHSRYASGTRAGCTRLWLCWQANRPVKAAG
jgi:hypothetical protein